MEDINALVEGLRRGDTILYPTDTIPGLGCDASNPEAVQKVIDLKGRHSDKGFIILLDDDRKLHTYMKEVPDVVWDLLEHNSEPLTVIYPNGKNVAPEVLALDGSIAIRIAQDPFCIALIRKFGKAIISTSANKSGEAPARSMNEVSADIRDSVDHIVNSDLGTAPDPKPSKIIKLALNGEFEFIRN